MTRKGKLRLRKKKNEDQDTICQPMRMAVCACVGGIMHDSVSAG